jgi:flagellin-like hook-associated protein FlgL
MAEIAFSAGIRSSLASLQQTSKQQTTVQQRLSTGRRVNSAIDNPTNFFAAANLNDRASLLSGRLDGMGQAISTLSAADNSITAMRGVVSALKGVVDEGLSTSTSSDRVSLGKQFNELIVQLGDFAKDADYKGVNLLRSTQSDATSGGNETLSVQFNESFDQSTLEIEGVNIRTAGVALSSAGEITTASNMSSSSNNFAISFNEEGVADGNASVVGIRSAEVSSSTESTKLGAAGTSSQIAWADNSTYVTNLESLVTQLESFDQALINTAKSLSQNVNIVSLRQDFTSNLINTLEEGADKLTLADLNEEGANLLALQTSQSLGLQSLALASQANQSVLGLIG